LEINSKFHFKFEDLLIYQKAIAFGEYVNELINKFPKHELYKLSSQFARASDSIALNIAEGHSGSDMNFNRYLIISQGSANECIACLTKARLKEYITYEEDEKVRELISEISKMNSSLRKTLKAND